MDLGRRKTLRKLRSKKESNFILTALFSSKKVNNLLKGEIVELMLPYKRKVRVMLDEIDRTMRVEDV